MISKRYRSLQLLLISPLFSHSLLLLLSLSHLYRVFTRMSPRQTMSLGDTMLQLLFRFIVSTVYGAYLPRSYVGSDGLLLLLLLLLLFHHHRCRNCCYSVAVAYEVLVLKLSYCKQTGRPIINWPIARILS